MARVFTEVTERGDAVGLAAGESAALSRYLYLKRSMESIERRHLYYRGYLDALALLKGIDMV